MKHRRISKLLFVTAACVLATSLIALVGCAGGGTLSSEFIEETGAYKVTADNASSGSSVVTEAAVTIEDGQVLLMSPDLKNGSLQVKLTDAKGTVAFDETASGRVLSTHKIAQGSYTAEVSCSEAGTTGSVLVFGVDEKDFAEQDQGLMDALAQQGVNTEQGVK